MNRNAKAQVTPRGFGQPAVANPSHPGHAAYVQRCNENRSAIYKLNARTRAARIAAAQAA